MDKSLLIEQPTQQATLVGLGVEQQFGGFADTYVDRIVADIVQHKGLGGNFAIFGNDDVARDLAQKILKSELSQDFLGCFHAEHENYDTIHRHGHELRHLEFDCILLCVPPAELRQSLRLLVYSYALTTDIIYPWVNERAWPASALEDPRPIVTLSHPCGGSHRVIFPIRAICHHYGRLGKDYFQPTISPRFIARYWRDGDSHPPLQEDVDEAFISQIRQLEYFQFMDVHQPFSFERLREVSDCRFVALLRDPRDIVTSYYHRLYRDPASDKVGFLGDQDDDLKEQRILEILDGGVFQFTSDYMLIWPSISYMIDNFVEAERNPEIYPIRFEDVHADPRGSFKDLLDRLGLSNEALTPFNDQQLDEAIALGSFELQTNGQRQRGDEANMVHYEDGVQTSCRKGVPGDWRNHFSPRVKDRVKELIGEDLCTLGYERDLQW